MAQATWDSLPKEIQEQMLNEQESQGNKRDPEVFMELLHKGKDNGGFNWYETEFRFDRWSQVINYSNFAPFYEFYGKKDPKKVCYKSDGTKETGARIIKALEDLGGIKRNRNGMSILFCYYFVGNDGHIDCEQYLPTGYHLSELPPIKDEDPKGNVKVNEVQHPKHYNSHPSGIECIEIAKHHDFCIGNVFKYIWRCGLKESETELSDLLKAREYLNFKIEQLTNNK